MKNLNIRAATADEQRYTYKYTYKKSSQISGQVGEIGYFRFYFTPGDESEISHTFENVKAFYKTDEFQAEFDALIKELRSNLLRSRSHMGRLLWEKYSDAELENGPTSREYALRVDTENHVYLLRLNSSSGNYSYIYCFVKKWLDGHMEQAKNGIRFITSRYETLFTVPDGGKVVLEIPGDEPKTRVCTYIDDYHFEFGDNVYHICEFAEQVARCGGTVHPAEEKG